MREFKYRVWSFENKIMTYTYTINELYEAVQDRIKNNIKFSDVMQSIKLPDKTGEEIYENDILQFQGLDIRFEVYYDTDYAQYRMTGVMNGLSQNFPIFSDLVKIVGNVYKNPSE